MFPESDGAKRNEMIVICSSDLISPRLPDLHLLHNYNTVLWTAPHDAGRPNNLKPWLWARRAPTNASRPHEGQKTPSKPEKSNAASVLRNDPQISAGGVWQGVQAQRSGQHPNGHSDMHRVAPWPRLQITIGSVAVAKRLQVASRRVQARVPESERPFQLQRPHDGR